ncbi:MAG TPA: hypothetical protein VFA03_08245 [Acetobacteraceae bacterium]|nr:hypothetical protein [Acetobacteraceae bacterium]
MFSPFDFDVCTSPEEQEEAAKRAAERESARNRPPSPARQPQATLPGDERHPAATE